MVGLAAHVLEKHTNGGAQSAELLHDSPDLPRAPDGAASGFLSLSPQPASSDEPITAAPSKDSSIDFDIFSSTYWFRTLTLIFGGRQTNHGRQDTTIAGKNA
jgi:hypothetical protein